MYKQCGILVTTLAVLGLGLWISSPQPAEAQQGQGNGLQRFAGTLWIVYDVPGLGPLPGITIAHSDGTLLGVDGSDEGFGGLASVNSAFMGVYEATGPFQTAGKTVYISFEAGFPIAAFVTTSVSDYNEDFSGGTGVLEQRRYDLTLGEDPLDPEQGTPFGDPIPYVFGALTP